MDSLAMIINKRGYHNLIIDFRGNSRLSAAAAFLLINYLSDQPFDAGVFLTRKWYDHNSGIPHVQDYQKLFRSLIGSDFPAGELYNEEGWYVNINPGARAFKGKVFLLTDSKTSKVAELTTYVIKDRKFATIVGQKTAGLTVLAGNLKLNSEYDLIIPECDFYTVEGKNLNRIGIEPDISKSGDDVMKYIFSAL